MNGMKVNNNQISSSMGLIFQLQKTLNGSENIMKNKPDHIAQNDWDEVDSPALSDDMLARMQPVSTAHPEIPSRVRGPQKAPTKVAISIRLSPQVLEYFKSLGKGWQTDLDEVLREYVASQK